MEIEDAILGTVISDPTLYHDRIIRGVSAEDFAKPNCQEAWIRIQRLVSSGNPISVENILKYSEKLTESDLKRWMTYKIFDVDTLREKAKELTSERRRLKAIAALRATIIEIEGGAQGWEEEVGDTIKNLLDSSITEPSISSLEVRMRIKEEIRNKRFKNEKIEMGIKALDSHLRGGLPLPSLTTIFAPAKAGKTTLAATISFHNEQKRVPHLVISLERSGDHIERMKIARENGCDVRNLNETLPDADDDFSPINMPSESFCKYKHSPKLTISEIKNEILYEVRQRNIKLVVVDYLQLIGGEKKFEKRQDFLARLMQTLSEIATDANIAIIVLAQLGEGVSQSELLAAEQSSNLVLIMNRDRGSPEIWFSNRASNISPEADIGAVTHAAAILKEAVGPHITDPDDFDVQIT